MNEENNLSFSQALEWLKAGNKVSREGWNGKGMFLYHVEANEYPALTDVAKKEFGETVKYRAYLALKTVQGGVVVWSASNTDLLANDWFVIR
jgi:hypothetical protein